jgi:hypothetical protein
MTVLQLAYLLDVIVSLPAAVTMLMGSETAARWLLGDKLPEERSSRIVLGSLWAAIALCSGAGVFIPVAMAPVLIVQVIYKSLWIGLHAVPCWLRGRSEEVPRPLAGTFLAYVIAYPWVIPWDALFR